MYSMKPLRYSVIMFCAVFILAVARVHAAERHIISDYAIRKFPITLAVAEGGDFGAPERPWYLLCRHRR